MSNVSCIETVIFTIFIFTITIYFILYRIFLKKKNKKNNNFAGRLQITPREEFHLWKDKKMFWEIRIIKLAER